MKFAKLPGEIAEEMKYICELSKFIIKGGENDEADNEGRMELERNCTNCNSFLPYPLLGVVEFGICLNDNLFEPYIEELLENQNYDCCLELVEQKKFDGNFNCCDDFSMVEIIGGDSSINDFVEIDINDDETLNKIISSVSKNKSVEEYIDKFQSPNPDIRLKAFESVSCLAMFGNDAATKLLINSFKEIPPPVAIDDTHFKLKALRCVNRVDLVDEIFPLMVRDLYETKSNNQTRQWISEILKFFNIHRNRKDVSEFLKKILREKQFTYRIKDKVKDILFEEGYF